MSVRKKSKFNQELAQEVLNFVAQQNAQEKAAPVMALTEALKAAFGAGGLGEVDRLIQSINKSIKERGGKFGLGEGAALQQYGSDQTLYLHISFASFDLDNIYCPPDNSFATKLTLGHL